jgi:hypothetical protein
MPLLFFAIFATVQFGLTYLGNSAASSAAREGARVARTGGNCADGADRAREILASVGKGLVEDVEVRPDCSDPEFVTMTVRGKGLSVVPGLRAITLEQTVTGPVESFRADTG